jgi:hypothetical protein
METTLTQEQAFRAMFLFLEDYYSRFSAATLGDILGDLQPAESGESSDPAAWENWLRVVDAVAH